MDRDLTNKRIEQKTRNPSNIKIRFCLKTP